MGPKVLLAILLSSMAIIAYQLSLMEILSIVQWHHFASLIISIALLGFGASGSCIFMFKRALLAHFEKVLAASMLLCALAMAAAPAIAQWEPLRFDTFLLFSDRGHFGRLALTCLIYFMPFFLGALGIGLAFSRHAAEIGKLYSANLLGSAFGGLLAIGLMAWLHPAMIPPLLALLPMLGAMLLLATRFRVIYGLAGLGLIGGILLHPPELVMSEFKPLKRAMDLPESQLLQTRPTLHGLMQRLKAPAMRHGGALSLNYTGDILPAEAVFKNGECMGFRLKEGHEALLNHTPAALPYVMGHRERVLFLEAGAGADIRAAVAQGAGAVTVVEPNPFLRDMLRQDYGVPVLDQNPRCYLASFTKQKWKYDLMVLPTVDVLGGSSGLYSLAENHLLTREAFRQMWDGLGAEGVISVNLWLDQPRRNSLKLVATWAELLSSLGMDPAKHVVAIRGWGHMGLVLKKSPITEDESKRVRRFCESMAFDLTLLPGLGLGERTRYHTIPDERWFLDLEGLLSTHRESVIAQYDFNIRPATDDRPYFFQFLSWRGLAHLKQIYGQRAIPFFELSFMILVIGMIQLAVMALGLICLPLLLVKKKNTAPRAKRWTFIALYFGGLALGFMCLEMVLIQRLGLLFGNPLSAAAAVIGALLAFSGLGSALSPRLPSRCLGVVLLGLMGLILLEALALRFLLPVVLGQSLPLQACWVLLLTGPLGIALGLPFPMAVRQLSEAEIPWAWGVNGSLSVIAASLATILAVEGGFTGVMMVAGLAYGLAALVSRRVVAPVGGRSCHR